MANNINKLKVECNILEGLRMELLENSLMKNNTRIYSTTKCEDLSEHFEFDRVFNNIDVIENMLIRVMEKPHVTKDIKVKIKAFKPIKVYKNKLTLLEKYENKIKG